MAVDRDFDDEPDLEPRGPFTFKLKGETFTTIPMAPAGVLNELQGGIQYTPQGERVYSAPNLISFIITVLRDTETIGADEAEARGVDTAGLEPDTDGRFTVPADDVIRFLHLVHDKHRVVDIAKLGKIVIWLAEEFSGRPIPPPAR